VTAAIAIATMLMAYVLCRTDGAAATRFTVRMTTQQSRRELGTEISGIILVTILYALALSLVRAWPSW
jgi:hypothetical protein